MLARPPGSRDVGTDRAECSESVRVDHYSAPGRTVVNSLRRNGMGIDALTPRPVLLTSTDM